MSDLSKTIQKVRAPLRQYRSGLLKRILKVLREYQIEGAPGSDGWCLDFDIGVPSKVLLATLLPLPPPANAPRKEWAVAIPLFEQMVQEALRAGVLAGLIQERKSKAWKVGQRTYLRPDGVPVRFTIKPQDPRPGLPPPPEGAVDWTFEVGNVDGPYTPITIFAWGNIRDEIVYYGLTPEGSRRTEEAERTGTKAAEPAAQKLPKLRPHDMQAWQVLQATGWSQEKIAQKLNEQHGTHYRQCDVSRMLRRAKANARASGLAAHIPPAAKPARPIDPHKLDIGRRVDGKAQRQRGKFQPD